MMALSMMAGKSAVELKNCRTAVSHRSARDRRKSSVTVPSPLRAMHSISISRMDIPRISSAPWAGLSSSTPAWISMASLAASRKLSIPLSLAPTTTGAPCWIMWSTAAARTASMVAPLRIYSAGSMPVWRHRARMSPIRWRSSATARWAFSSPVVLGVPAGGGVGVFTGSWPPTLRWPPAGSPPPLSSGSASIWRWSASNSACSSAVRPRPAARAASTISCCRLIHFALFFMLLPPFCSC